jgi:hypothetical protein
MTPDSTYTDTLIWGTPAHLVGYFRPVRQSDTMDITPNDSWRLLEPKTDIPRPVASVSVQTEKPYDHIARCTMAGSCTVVLVMLPLLVWMKLRLFT